MALRTSSGPLCEEIRYSEGDLAVDGTVKILVSGKARDPLYQG